MLSASRLLETAQRREPLGEIPARILLPSSQISSFSRSGPRTRRPPFRLTGCAIPSKHSGDPRGDLRLFLRDLVDAPDLMCRVNVRDLVLFSAAPFQVHQGKN